MMMENIVWQRMKIDLHYDIANTLFVYRINPRLISKLFLTIFSLNTHILIVYKAIFSAAYYAYDKISPEALYDHLCTYKIQIPALQMNIR